MVIEGIPGAAFVLEVVAFSTVAGAAYAHHRHQRDRRFEVERSIANYSFTALCAGALAQLLSVLAT